MATATWIVDQVESRLRDEPECKLSILMSDLLKKYGLNVKYHKAWRGKEIALERIFRSYEYSYSMVPTWCFKILRTKYSLEGQHQFHRFFISFAACCFAFLSGCHQFIGLDGCHLKGKYKGTLLSAIALNGNNGIILVAFAVVEVETKDSWFTFLEQLRDSINSDQVTFLSDRQKGLTESVQAVFPKAHHRFCVRHMYKNFQKEHEGLLRRNIFWRAARAYTIYEFNKEMEKLKELSPQACAWCDAVPPYQWSRAYFNEDVKCKELTNNFSESWNNFIVSARAQPICDPVGVIRRKLMVKFHDRRKESNAWENVIVKQVDEMKRLN
ncbi:hypothetical protein MRB53_016096 [Persea americana]|uniref:Uncharacterized protein n=1 Tax=Persea americana TaxID=3435 RepID=A0ACC2M0Y8_PERAE|nr:hypothetical protein MRB53_016096 [Persea americana]